MANSGIKKGWLFADRFGTVDPILDIDDHLCPCPCGNAKPDLVLDYPSTEQLDRRGGSGPRGLKQMHFVDCPSCKRRGLPAAADWAAAIEWNREHYSASIPLSRFPFFGLDTTDLRGERLRLNAIRADLECAVRRAPQRRHLGFFDDPHPKEYLQAMLAWTIAAQTLLKQHARHRQAVLEGRQTSTS